MGERVAAGQRSPQFDRIGKPEPGSSQHRRHEGKEALYSTSPAADPSPHVVVRCPRCEVETNLHGRDAIRLLRPPFLVDPLRRRLVTQCPACGERACLKVSLGATLRAYVAGRPRAG